MMPAPRSPLSLPPLVHPATLSLHPSIFPYTLHPAPSYTLHHQLKLHHTFHLSSTNARVMYIPYSYLTALVLKFAIPSCLMLALPTHTVYLISPPLHFPSHTFPSLILTHLILPVLPHSSFILPLLIKPFVNTSFHLIYSLCPHAFSFLIL